MDENPTSSFKIGGKEEKKKKEKERENEKKEKERERKRERERERESVVCIPGVLISWEMPPCNTRRGEPSGVTMLWDSYNHSYTVFRQFPNYVSVFGRFNRHAHYTLHMDAILTL